MRSIILPALSAIAISTVATHKWIWPDVPSRSEPAFATFLLGTWSCRGGTPAGKQLNADVTFTRELDGHWLESAHRDRPPGRYQSAAFWPLASNEGPIATVVYDNFDGARRFLSNGWTPDSIVWLRDTTEARAVLESFTYRRTGSNAYRYSWHVRRSGGGAMSLGDSATCTRV